MASLVSRLRINRSQTQARVPTTTYTQHLATNIGGFSFCDSCAEMHKNKLQKIRQPGGKGAGEGGGVDVIE
jgi:hypothetical protein